MSRVSRIAAAAAMTLVVFRAGPAGAAYPGGPPERILMLGNSLTRGVPRMLRRLFDADGLRVRVKAKAPSSWTLRDHFASSSSHTRIAREPWDIVVLQEQSEGIGPARYPDARDLDQVIVANGSATMFFMTWRTRGSAPQAYDALRGVPGGDEGYIPIAFELGAPVAPAGWAFRNAVAADPSVDLWKDGRHANTRGRYLAACVFYATIMSASPVGLDWQPGRLDDADALSLQQLAADTVLLDPAGWNIPPP